jgi:hypothetical protein
LGIPLRNLVYVDFVLKKLLEKKLDKKDVGEIIRSRASKKE